MLPTVRIVMSRSIAEMLGQLRHNLAVQHAERSNNALEGDTLAHDLDCDILEMRLLFWDSAFLKGSFITPAVSM